MSNPLTTNHTCGVLQAADEINRELRRLHEMDRIIAAGGNIYEAYAELRKLVKARYRLELTDCIVP